MFRFFKKEYLFELKRIFTDPGAILILVLAAILYSAVYSLPYSTEVIKDVPIGVCDNDNTKTSRDFIQKIDSNPYVQIVSRPLNLEEAKRQLNKQEIYAYVEIPSDFAKDIKQGEKTSVSVYTDSGYLIVYRQIMTNLNLVTGTVSKGIEIKNIVKETGNFDKAIDAAMPVNISETPLFNSAGGYESYIFPSVLILILQQTMLVGIGLLCGTDREKGLFKGITEKEIPYMVLARSSAYVTIYLFHSGLYFLVIPKICGYPLYMNIPLLILLIIPYLYSTAFLGQTLTFFFEKRESSLISLVVLSLPLAFLPGIIWPKEAIPELIRWLSMLLPSTSGVDAIVKVNQMGAGLKEIGLPLSVLIILMVSYFITAKMVFKKLRNEK